MAHHLWDLCGATRGGIAENYMLLCSPTSPGPGRLVGWLVGRLTGLNP